MNERIRTLRATLEHAIGTLQSATDREALEAELLERMEPYGPDGPWKYAPAGERLKAQKAIKAEQQRRAGLALHAVESGIRELSPMLTDAIARAKRAPDAESVFRERLGAAAAGANNGTNHLLVGVLDELRRARLTSELRTALPSVLSARYADAIADPTEQGNATTIRVIEHLLDGGGWQAATRDEGELTKAQELRRRVEAVQSARVPAEAGDVAVLVSQARTRAQRARDLHKVSPVHPE